MNVLFVCEGNKMRSQMAEAFYNQLTGTQNASSAGAIADDGTQISQRCIDVMNEVGIDMTDRRSTLLTQELVTRADKLMLFPTDYMPDFAKDADNVEVWDVADPHYNKDKGMDFVRQVRDDIRKHIEALIETTKL